MTITCKSGDRLDHIPNGTVDAVVMDPPYYDNVMYAELSDFFYVWLKRTAVRTVFDNIVSDGRMFWTAFWPRFDVDLCHGDIPFYL
jgi:adenine-specific DNA methylase